VREPGSRNRRLNAVKLLQEDQTLDAMPALKYKFDLFEADVNAAELRRSGTRLKLQLQPFQVLVALLERPGEVVTREELRQRLWPQDTFVDFDHGLNTAMAKLRDVLGDSAGNPRYVETIAKRGYRFLGDVQVVQDPPAGKAPAPVAVPASDSAVNSPAGVAVEPGPGAARESELPRASRSTSRVLFVLAQMMYLIFYLSALFDWQQLYRAAFVVWPSAGQVVFVVSLVTALVGIAVRLYLITATAFDYHLLGEKYRLIYPGLFVLDMIWALAPLLLTERMGLGLALGACAALLYLPFAQRVLMKMITRA
jgi:cholera toxin transcriptional activator